MRNLGIVIGAALLIGGLFATAFGVLGLGALGDCRGDVCADGFTFVALPAGIVGIVIGTIVLGAGLSAARAAGARGVLTSITGMTALGGVFAVLGAIFLLAVTRSGDIEVSATFGLLGVIFLLTGIGILAVDQWLAGRRRRAERLRTAGMRGQATVLEVSDSNITVNNNPMIKLRMRVAIPNHPPYEVSKRMVVSRIGVGQYMPGSQLPVLVDPANPKDVMIDDAAQTDLSGATWSGAGIGGAAAPAWLQGFQTFRDGGQDPGDLLRTIGAALTQAAEHAQASGAGSLGAPNVTTQVIDGGTWITVNGQTMQVPSLTPTPGSAPAIPGGAMAPASLAIGASTAEATGAADRDPADALGAYGPTPGLTAASPTGIPNGRVSIDSLTDTGVVIGDARLFTFGLTVSPAGGRPYPVQHAALVPNAHGVRVIRGASFPARIDAALPGGLGIYWDR